MSFIPVVDHILQLQHGSALLQVRSMKDNVGEKALATPSTAVQMSGLNAVPIAGDDFIVAASLDEVKFCARCIASLMYCAWLAVL